VASVINDLLRLHRAQLQGVIELRGVRRMRPIYEAARADLEAKLAGLRRAGKGTSFTAHHMRQVLLQVNEGLSLFEQNLSGHMAKTGKMAGTLSQRHLISAVKKLEKKFTGTTPILRVEEASVLRGVYKKVEPSLLDRYSTRRYSVQALTKIKDALAQSLVSNHTVDEAVTRVVESGGVFDDQRWRAERIVRSELSYSYGVVKQKSMEEMAKTDTPDLMKRLVATIDDRTGDDSKELNGQTVPFDQPFLWRKRLRGGGEEVVPYMQPP